MQLVLTAIGFIGAAAVLGAFALSAAGRLAPASTAYHALNVGGATGLVLSGAASGAWPSVASNGAWVVISLVGLRALLRARRAAAGPVVFEPPTAELFLPTAELRLPTAELRLPAAELAT